MHTHIIESYLCTGSEYGVMSYLLCVDVCVCVCKGVCTELNFGCCYLGAIHLVFETGCLTGACGLPIRISWVDSEPQMYSHVHLHKAEITSKSACLAFFKKNKSFWEYKVWLHTCMANTYLIELSSQPQHVSTSVNKQLVNMFPRPDSEPSISRVLDHEKKKNKLNQHTTTRTTLC